jgi:hypothetical protein
MRQKRMAKSLRILRSTLLISIGIFAMVFGEFDDSPGLQGLGMILILMVLYRDVRGYRERNRG